MSGDEPIGAVKEGTRDETHQRGRHAKWSRQRPTNCDNCVAVDERFPLADDHNRIDRAINGDGACQALTGGRLQRSESQPAVVVHLDEALDRAGTQVAAPVKQHNECVVR